MVDVITAGFPCEPFSVAGKRRGADDERNMWPATIECIRVVRPRFALMENVPGLVANGYFDTVIADLVESGYDARWRILSAAEVGAPHKRDRLWILAHASGERLEGDLRLRNGECPCERLPWACCRAHEDDRLARSGICRVSHGVPHRVDRIKALGNAQVPAVAATAWLLLSEHIT